MSCLPSFAIDKEKASSISLWKSCIEWFSAYHCFIWCGKAWQSHDRGRDITRLPPWLTAGESPLLTRRDFLGGHLAGSLPLFFNKGRCTKFKVSGMVFWEQNIGEYQQADEGRYERETPSDRGNCFGGKAYELESLTLQCFTSETPGASVSEAEWRQWQVIIPPPGKNRAPPLTRGGFFIYDTASEAIRDPLTRGSFYVKIKFLLFWYVFQNKLCK